MRAIHINLILLFGFLILSCGCVQPPANPDLLSDTSFTLVGDTLFSTGNIKIYPQQKWLSGKGSDENGWFKTITFKSPANWALLLGRKMEIENNVDYQIDEGIRTKDKVKEYLPPNDTLVVTKIQKRGNTKWGYKYVVYLRQGKGLLSLQYECYLAEALKTEEMLLVKM